MTFDLASRTFACLLLGLRVAPLFALAPPFSQIRLPSTFRVLFGLGLAACLAAGNPSAVRLVDFSLGSLVMVGARELLLGTIFVMAFQLMFGMLYVAGRTIDIQAGFVWRCWSIPPAKARLPLSAPCSLTPRAPPFLLSAVPKPYCA
ncbi:MAG: flagellar biosynthetic protein FliR [Asticcacaulis sp.]